MNREEVEKQKILIDDLMDDCQYEDASRVAIRVINKQSQHIKELERERDGFQKGLNGVLKNSEGQALKIKELEERVIEECGRADYYIKKNTDANDGGG